ncbi:MAG: hypothetical protein M1827_005363 [Pycnora praestabilis]|nr:MAG: hypothetical protein M1827_005363 [Pycnora praestabilis]
MRREKSPRSSIVRSNEPIVESKTIFKDVLEGQCTHSEARGSPQPLLSLRVKGQPQQTAKIPYAHVGSRRDRVLRRLQQESAGITPPSIRTVLAVAKRHMTAVMTGSRTRTIHAGKRASFSADIRPDIRQVLATTKRHAAAVMGESRLHTRCLPDLSPRETAAVTTESRLRIRRVLAFRKRGTEAVTAGSRLCTRDVAKTQRKTNLSSTQWRHNYIRRLAAFMAGGASRTKYVSLQLSRSPTERFSTLWTTHFAFINSTQDRLEMEKNALFNSTLHRNVLLWIEEISSTGMNAGAMSIIWKGLPWKVRALRWQHIMLWFLQTSPDYALQFLEASNMRPRPPAYAVVDSLDYIASYYLQDSESPDLQAIENLHHIVPLILRSRGSSLNIHVSQKTIYLLIKHSRKEQTRNLFTTLILRNIPLHENTLLHFAVAFARDEDFQRSVDIMKSMLTLNADLSSPKFLSVCSTVIRLAAAEGDQYTRSSEILTEFLEVGLRPNLRLFNVVMLMALKAGDWQNGWRLHDMMKWNGLQPDEYTYAILMKYANERGDSESIERIINIVEKSEHLARSPMVLHQILMGIYILRRKNLNLSPFYAMLSMYQKLFSSKPLQDLGLIQKSTPGLSPPPEILGTMILAFLRTKIDPSRKASAYEKYHEHVRSGHPLISPLAETDHTSNAFLKALGHTRGTLYLCPRIVEHMLKSTHVLHPLSKTESRQIRQAEPTIQTWSILSAAFIRHGQRRAAEKVIEMMRNRGQQPNKVTWNALIWGYANMQDVNGVIDAMTRMDKENWTIDAFTLKGLAQLRDRQALLNAFDKTENASNPVEPGVSEEK